jgi:hypothetical protein
MIRLIADGHIDRWTRANRKEYAKKKHELAMAGVFPIPRGIGLSAVKPKSEEA